MYLELIALGIVCMIAPVFARFAGYETGRKPFDLCGVAGIFFLLTVACGEGVSLAPQMAGMCRVSMLIALTLGWLSLAVGAIWGAIDVVREPDRTVVHQHAPVIVP